MVTKRVRIISPIVRTKWFACGWRDTPFVRIGPAYMVFGRLPWAFMWCRADPTKQTRYRGRTRQQFYQPLTSEGLLKL